MLDEPVVSIAHVLFEAKAKAAARDPIQRPGADPAGAIPPLDSDFPAHTHLAIDHEIVVVQHIRGIVFPVPRPIETHNQPF